MRNNYYSFVGKQSYLFMIVLFTMVHGLFAQVTELEIWQIQGNEKVSPYNGSLVRTTDNVVTAVGDEFFYIQTPTARSDNDPETSDGIMVFLDAPPSVQPGDLVTVSGNIQEYFGQTEFSGNNMVVSVNGTGQELPEAVKIDDQFPGLLPEDVPDLEQVEGMLVQISGISTAPSDEHGQFPVRGGPVRAFREPGILYPGQNGLPVWDGNPEVFLFDPDGLGAPDNRLVAGGTLVNAVAVFDHKSWGYVALPIEYTLEEVVGVRPVREKHENEITVASLNTLRLITGSSGYSKRIGKFARYIQELMKSPDIIGFQEVGSKRVLDDLANQLKFIDASLDYESYFIAGDGDIHTGFLAKKIFSSPTVTQLGRNETLSNGSRMHDRPPLVLEVQYNGQILRVMNIHMRSLNGIEGNDADRVRLKRFEQSVSVAQMVQQLRDENLIILGDYNAFEFTDGYVDVVSQIQGSTSLGAEYQPQNIVNPPLDNLVLTHQVSSEHYSFIFDDNAQILDHCLANDLPGFAATELAFVRGNADQPVDYFDNYEELKRTSDHDGFVVYLSTDITSSASNTMVMGPSINYPNPIQAGQTIDIQLKNSQAFEWSLIDAFGKVMKTAHSKGEEIQYTWPENSTPGMYFLTLRTKTGLFTRKIVAH